MSCKPLSLSILCIICGFAVGVRGGDNLVLNPNFEHGLAHWKTEFPEPNETKYGENHKLVSAVDNPDGDGKVVLLDVTPKAAPSQGVKAVTRLMRIEKDESYRFGAEVYTTGSAVKIFLEGYREDPEQSTAGHDKYPGLRRVFRKTIHVRPKANEWSEWYQVAAPPPARYQPTIVLVKLYGYHPAGKVYFRNVVLEKVEGEREGR